MSSTVTPTGVAMGVSNQQSPRSSFVYGFSLTLVSGTPQVVDLRALQNINLLKDVQGIYFDNSANDTACEVSVATGQNITCPPQSQGEAPIFVPASQPVFTFSGNGTVYIVLTNFSVPAQFWSVVENTLPIVGGLVQVSDVALDAIITDYALNVSAVPINPWVSYSGTTVGASSTQLFPGGSGGTVYAEVFIAAPVTADLWVNRIGGTASIGGLDCFKIPAGTVYESNFGSQVNSEWTYYCATGALNYTALVRAQ